MEDKKYSLFKVIGIAFLLYVILTWFIPTGSFSSGEFIKGDVTSVGLYGIFTSPIYSFAVFAQYLILILSVGGFYGVLNKTGIYHSFVSKVASLDRKIVLVSTIVLFSLITSIFGETMMIFVLLPFFVAVLSKSGYDKLSCLGATIGGGLIGLIASISGNMAIYKNYFGLESTSFIVFNIIMLLIFVFLLSMFIFNRNTKKSVKTESIPLFEVAKKNGKSYIPLVIVFVSTILVLLLGLFNWHYSFGIDIFNVIHEKIVGNNIVSKIIGNVSEIGYFNNYDASAILIISSFLVSWLYGIKFNDYIDSFKNGAKEMLIPGIYVIFASVIFSQIATASNGNISLTISNFILKLSSDFNIFTGVLTGICGSFFYNDYLYFMNGLYGIVSLYNVSMMPFILSVFQSMFGIMMFILPVSITLIGGLKYLNISYKEWIKYIWRFLIQVFLISIIGCIILSMII